MPDRPTGLFELVAGSGRGRSLRAGASVFHEGDLGDGIYACVRGRLKLAVTTSTGREVVLAMIGPGAVFGELSAIDGGPRSCSATALESTRLAMLTRDELLDALSAAPELALVLLRSLTTHLRSANGRTAEGADTPVATRAARRMVDLARVIGRHGAIRSVDGGVAAPEVVVLPITQQELAGLIGVTREATARALAPLRDAGVLETSRGRIVVVDLARLGQIAGGG